MPAPLSLSSVVLGTTPSVWRMWQPADAAARWVSALGAVLPWLVLAQWGVQLTYSWAGGMLPLALWWAGRLCLAPWSHVLEGRRSSLLGAALAGVGMWVLVQDAHGHLQLLAWAGVVLGWLVFSESLRGLRTSSSEGGGFAHVALPVTAALIWLLAGDPLAWQSHWLWHIVVLLTLGAAAFLLAPQARRVASSPPALPALPPDGATLSSRSIMGLMMGGLFVFDQSCLGPAWPPATVIGLHLGVMTVLSGLAMALRATSLHAEPVGALLRPWRLPLMLVGSMLLLAASGPPWTLFGMVLQVLPWVIDMHWR
ncbi:MAG: hypothetical protein RL459_658, partial [Pseudomonadota bacterium]